MLVLLCVFATGAAVTPAASVAVWLWGVLRRAIMVGPAKVLREEGLVAPPIAVHRPRPAEDAVRLDVEPMAVEEARVGRPPLVPYGAVSPVGLA